MRLINLPTTSTFKKFFSRPTEAEKFESKHCHEAAKNRQEKIDRLVRFEMKQALTPLCGALLQAEQEDDGAEPVEPTEPCPPTLRANELYPTDLPNYADAL